MTEIISTDGQGDDTETVATQTVSEFFDTLARRTVVVRENMTSEYVYAGHTYNEDGNRVVALYHSRDGGRTLLSYEACQDGNSWSAVEIEGGGLKCVEPIVLNLMNSCHDRLENQLETERQLRDVEEQLRSVTADFEQVNSFINGYATQQGMCGDYERRLDDWNDSLNTLQLIGRPRDWSVRMRIRNEDSNNGLEGYIDVEARTQAEAHASVENLSASEVLRRFASGNDYYEVEILS